MPVRYRDFNYQMLIKVKQEEEKQIENAKSSNSNQGTVAGPMGQRRRIG